MRDARIIAIDTCLAACSVAVMEGETVLAAISEPMVRGHQERLASMARETMEEAGLTFADLDRIGVTVGPGSFTGLRVGLAFAKGLSAALDKPCVGVSSLEALAASADGFVVAAIDAKRGQLYLQVFDDGQALMAPDVLPVETAAARLAELHRGAATLVGSGAPLLAPTLPAARVLDIVAPYPVAIARLAARSAVTPPRPLYLRPPDARPAA